VGDLGDSGDVAAEALIVARLEEEAAALCWCSCAGIWRASAAVERRG
jgi:hypothetical protein